MRLPKCFTCKNRPPGNPVGGPYSAYCADCQPVNPAPVPPGRLTCLCAECGRFFTSETAFNRHRVVRPVRSCADPETRGLVRSTLADPGGEWEVWGWPDSGRPRPGRDTSSRVGSEPVGEREAKGVPQYTLSYTELP